MLKITPLLFLLTLSSSLSAHNLQVGQPLPPTEVSEHGEILLEGQKTSYQNWDTNQVVGKVRVIQAIAGRSSAKEQNADLMSAITQSQFPAEKYQTTTIINQDDAIWGTSGFVKSSAEDSKIEFPWSSIVLDETGVVAENWDLLEKSSTIVVLDAKGNVQFVKTGALNSEEITKVLELVRSYF